MSEYREGTSLSDPEVDFLNIHNYLFGFFFNQIPRVKVLLTLVPLFALVLKNEAPPLPAPSLPDASASDSSDDPEASASAPQTYEDTTPAPTDKLGEL